MIVAASPAPAFAASMCPGQRLNWDSYANGTRIASGQGLPVGGTTVTISYTGNTGAANNSTVNSAQTGGTSNTLRFYDVNGSGSQQTITISFSQPVRNLRFTVLDIDNEVNSWGDRVIVNTGGYTAVLGSQTTGNGTAASPYQNTSPNNVPGTSAAGNAALTWAGPISSVSLTYAQYNGIVQGSPFIGLSDIVFDPTLTC